MNPDFDECKSDCNDCQANQKCINQIGSYQCVCPSSSHLYIFDYCIPPTLLIGTFLSIICLVVFGIVASIIVQNHLSHMKKSRHSEQHKLPTFSLNNLNDSGDNEAGYFRLNEELQDDCDSFAYENLKNIL